MVYILTNESSMSLYILYTYCIKKIGLAYSPIGVPVYGTGKLICHYILTFKYYKFIIILYFQLAYAMKAFWIQTRGVGVLQ